MRREEVVDRPVSENPVEVLADRAPVLDISGVDEQRLVGADDEIRRDEQMYLLTLVHHLQAATGPVDAGRDLARKPGSLGRAGMRRLLRLEPEPAHRGSTDN